VKTTKQTPLERQAAKTAKAFKALLLAERTNQPKAVLARRYADFADAWNALPPKPETRKGKAASR